MQTVGPNTSINLSGRPRTLLCLAFAVWKLLLFSIAIFSPGPGYDTSTTLLNHGGHGTQSALGSHPWLQKLVRWDAIYFTAIAQRGYMWEQEWAFGWGYTKLISAVVQGILLNAWDPLPYMTDPASM